MGCVIVKGVNEIPFCICSITDLVQGESDTYRVEGGSGRDESGSVGAEAQVWKREGRAIGAYYGGADIGGGLEVFVFVVLIVVDRRMRRNIITETPGTITANYL